MTPSMPSPKDVAVRAVVLGRVVTYALDSPPRDKLEAAMRSWSQRKREDFLRDAEEPSREHWASLGDLRASLTPREQAFAATTMASMTQQQVDASWRLEALVVLLWALKGPALPGPDVMAPHELARSFGEVDAPSFVAGARLRPHREIERARSDAQLWHWRSRTRKLMQAGEALPAQAVPPGSSLRTYEDVIRLTARRAADDGMIPRVIADDFPARGKAYRDLRPDEWSEVASVTAERHFALNWLCGYAPEHRWDETPTDT
jgi:hypothetical protein